MSGIRVLAPGLQTTMQDLGRFGCAHHGVSASGAADSLALRAANLLVGNAENAPALEMTLAGPTLQFEQDVVVALTGSDFGSGLPLWSASPVREGEVLTFGATRSGARCYLAVRGGFDAPLTMGSASVHIVTGVGGRPVRKGDHLKLRNQPIRRARTRPAAPFPGDIAGVLRVTEGPQAEWFGDGLYRSAYTLTEESNRMGLRLRGNAITAAHAGAMLTEGVALGAIQAPPDGQPIILFVEHQTSGGYPKPANVISADFWRLGQLRPRDQVAFELVTIHHALQLLQQQEKWLYELIKAD